MRGPGTAAVRRGPVGLSSPARRRRGAPVDDLFDFASMPHLETERLILRQVRPTTNREAFFDLFADPDVARFTDTGPFGSREEADGVIALTDSVQPVEIVPLAV